ncbi:MAG: hypothetical protein PHF87_10305 [Desulfotomaculaceae bacterium]|nr:hypothetical protein [Desulfotomaculaceae bacterium]
MKQKHNGKRSTKVVEKLGTFAELKQKLNGQDPIEWAKSYVEELNKKEKKQSRDVAVIFFSSRSIMNSTCISFPLRFLRNINSLLI